MILAESRRLEDSIGALALIEPIHGHLRMLEPLVREARGALRPAVVSLAAQYAQFTGWLHASAGHTEIARSCYDRATEWALEAGDANMVATALSMKGHLACTLEQIGPMLGLSQAARRDERRVSPGLRAMTAQQEARAHALLGEGDATDHLLDEAIELIGHAEEHPDAEPPWLYFFSPAYLTMQRGRAYRYLGGTPLPPICCRPAWMRCPPSCVALSGQPATSATWRWCGR
ncbi:MAG: hypothetical protein M3Z25_16610 [Actinomycetota bacterium]|nr:hypothetical protein [Actinomycetota bacterium]